MIFLILLGADVLNVFLALTQTEHRTGQVGHRPEPVTRCW
jgi:hypothetical protein